MESILSKTIYGGGRRLRGSRYVGFSVCQVRKFYNAYYEKGGVKVNYYTTGFISYPRVDHRLAQDWCYPM